MRRRATACCCCRRRRCLCRILFDPDLQLDTLPCPSTTCLCRILFDPDLQLDTLPIYNVLLGRAPDNSALLVVQSIGKNGRLGLWRLVRSAVCACVCVCVCGETN